MQTGNKVNWNWQPRNGYGAFHSVAGIVIKVTAKRVRIAIYNLRTKEIEETTVKPESLSPRTNTCEIDDAMEQARQHAAPFIEALQETLA